MTSTVEDPMVTAAVSRIVDRFHPVRIILFGSRARGDEREDSDYDFLVVLRESANRFDDTVRILAVLADLPISKDVVVVTPESLGGGGKLGSVVRPALKEGRILYERGGELLDMPAADAQETAREWLTSAEADLRAAQAMLGSDSFEPRHVGFFAQRAAEKAVKAALIAAGEEPPMTHNIQRLAALVEGDIATVHRELLEALTAWGWRRALRGAVPGVGRKRRRRRCGCRRHRAQHRIEPGGLSCPSYTTMRSCGIFESTSRPVSVINNVSM
jgi:HEPN domain-containing protein/predicted nucleotidyltransferase